MTIKELEWEIDQRIKLIDVMSPEDEEYDKVVQELEELQLEYQFKCDERDRYADIHG